MKFTLNDCISRINQALNYPSIQYEDVSHFFDQAIAELNTSFRIGLPSVTEMRFENTFKITESPNTILLTSSPTADNAIPTVSDLSTATAQVVYYVKSGGTEKYENSLYVKKNGNYEPVSELYAFSFGKAYVAVPVAFSYAVWVETSLETVTSFNLLDYLPFDWWMLFVIPYVCFKSALRDGGNGSLFSDEFTQGFQQLQTSYGVPNTVRLSDVAHLKAYKNLVTDNIANLDKHVATRAVFDTMRISDGVRKTYGAELFDNGGWGI